jgi:hypothetical protein
MGSKNILMVLSNVIEVGEVSLAWLGYELPKLGVAGSNPALRIYAKNSYFKNKELAEFLFLNLTIDITSAKGLHQFNFDNKG